MKKTVLVIEDEPDIRYDIAKALGLSGYNVLQAGNGTEGIKVALEELPDLIISDIMMPVVDGYGVLEAVQKSNNTNTIPFIFLSAKSSRGDIRDGMGLGADDYITKPFDIDELLAAVERRLTKQEATKEKYNQKFEALSDNLRRSMPHEVRTPLNIILGLSEFLRKNYDSTTHKDAMEMLQNINDSAKRLQRIFENYIFYANLEVAASNASEIKLMQSKKIMLAEYLLRDITMYMAGNAGRTDDIQLDLEDANIKISETFFTKMLEEIIDNAFKFSDRSQPVKIQSAVVDDFYAISVTDFGRGMTREQIENVDAHIQFERTIYEQQGLGLGLAIAKKVATLHNGEFIIKSEVGVSTTVTIKLPIAPD